MALLAGLNHFRLGLFHQVEALACIVHCNDPDKLHHFFKNLINKATLPTDVLPAAYIDYSLSHGMGLVMSTGYGICHQPHWRKPYLKAKMMYGLRVILLIIEDINNGSMTRDEASKRLSKEVKCAGNLMGNHLFAVSVLRGIILP